MEHGKMEVFHFYRSHRVFNPPPLDLMPLEGLILHQRNTWYYLGFIFDQKLLFQQHIDFYTNKIFSTIKCVKMLGNSSRGLSPIQKRCLYRCCTLPIALYGFQLWYYNKVPLAYLLKELRKIQKRVALQILGTFHISSSLGIEAISGLIPIYLHLQKLNSRFHLRAYSLPDNHIIRSLLETRPLLYTKPYQFNKVFLFFSPFHFKFSLGSRLIDVFSNCFFFHSLNRKSKQDIESHLLKLNNITLQPSSNHHSVVVVTDASIKNQVAMSITHVLSRSKKVDLIYFIFPFIFHFFYFSIFRTTRVRGYQSHCHISHNLMAQSQDRS